jgi:hypothetical protein
MTQLNQILAIEKSARNNAAAVLTKSYQNVQKGAPLSGISRTYQPLNDEGQKLPAESVRVQLNAADIAVEVRDALARMFDVVGTKDNTNRFAVSDIVVDGVTLATDVPVTTLLFLEKQLTDLTTFISKLPTLDPSDEWVWSDDSLCYTSAPVQTVRTTKVPRNHVLAQATDKHPAQVQVWQEDVPVGTWTTVKRSGALKAREVAEALNRVRALADAVKQARERANQTEVKNLQVGTSLLGYVFGS